jgi:hypothetical protein
MVPISVRLECLVEHVGNDNQPNDEEKAAADPKKSAGCPLHRADEAIADPIQNPPSKAPRKREERRQGHNEQRHTHDPPDRRVDGLDCVSDLGGYVSVVDEVDRDEHKEHLGTDERHEPADRPGHQRLPQACTHPQDPAQYRKTYDGCIKIRRNLHSHAPNVSARPLKRRRRVHAHREKPAPEPQHFGPWAQHRNRHRGPLRTGLAPFPAFAV